MTVVGYGRVSKDTQDLFRQEEALKKAGCEKIYMEKFTGKTRDRKVLKEMIEELRSGDKLIIESFSRLGRSSLDLFTLLDDFNKMGVEVISLKEKFDTKTAMGAFSLQMFIAVAELERNLISERTKESLAVARKKGRFGGRPKTEKKVLDRALQLYDSKELTIDEVLSATGISRATLYKAVNERKLKEESKEE